MHKGVGFKFMPIDLLLSWCWFNSFRSNIWLENDSYTPATKYLPNGQMEDGTLFYRLQGTDGLITNFKVNELGVADEYSALIPDEVFDLTKAYTIQIRAIDDIGEYDLKTFDIPTRDVALHLGKGGKNVSVGSYCDYSEEYTFHSEWKGIFDDDVEIGGDLYIGGMTLADYIRSVIN